MNQIRATRCRPKPGRKSPPSAFCWRQRAAALGLAAGLHLLPLNKAHAEDQAGYRWENYKEDGARVSIETHSGMFEKRIRPWLNLKGEVTYDAISGASPYGAPPPSTVTFSPFAFIVPPLSTTVPLLPIAQDIRWAGTFEAGLSYGPHLLTPQFSYSEEHDYISYGAALNYAIDLNQKNTTLNFGWSHNWDKILAKHLFLSTNERKNSDDFLVGVNQLLGPKTVLTADFTYGNARGYLNDQYKGVLFESDVDSQGDQNFPVVRPEKRPRHRDRYIGFASLTQAITPLHASVEGSYRFFHDTYGINAHTVSLAWFQKFGKRVVISPLFRYYRQSAANFYYERLPDFNNAPPSYSADYRLSELETFTGGATANVKVTDWFGIDLGYKRYVMAGLDHVTSGSAYPSANIFTVGGRVWF